MSMPPLKFVPTTFRPDDRKRKQFCRACEDCRKKKRRCLHTPEDISEKTPRKAANRAQHQESDDHSRRRIVSTQFPATLTPPPSLNLLENQPSAISATDPHRGVEATCQSHQVASITPSEEVNNSRDEAGTVYAEGISARSSRFVGDMNPEGIFFSTAGPEAHQNTSTRGSIGVWLAEQHGHTSRHAERCATPLPRPSLFHGFKPSIQRAIMPILEEECILTIPPLAQRNVLQAAYFERFHPLLPIVNKSIYDSLPHDSPSRLLLDQGMCLVASMDSTLRQHLCLSDESRVLPFQDFGHRLLAAMRTNIEIGRIADRVLLVQLLALMSLFQEGPDGCENSLLTLGRAVQHLHSLGLHLRKERENLHWKHAETLFCCIWFLDRLSAASQGRPVLMHERDISRSMRQAFDAQEPSFQLVLRIGAILDDVITLYRPDCTDNKVAYDFNLFEDLAVECHATQISPDLLATIEVLYHAVAILSCHLISDGSDHQAPSSSRRTRQSWSAERATGLVGHEFRDQLVPLPFIPYAISLSLSVSYRDLRRSKVPAHRARARNRLEVNCRILEELSEISGSAAAMANMANLTLNELNRVYTNAKDDEQHRKLSHDHVESYAESLQGQVLASQSAQIGTEAAFSIPHDFDVYFFSDMAGQDPFDMFDPKYNLDSIDAFLEGNLDPAVSM